jgi:hypothetical protein
VATETLTDAIQTLTPEQQDCVRQFVDFLRGRQSSTSPFLAAVDEFIDRHPELLQRLAK